MVGDVSDQEDTLRLGQRAEDVGVLRVVGIRGVSESRKKRVDGDGEDVL